MSFVFQSIDHVQLAAPKDSESIARKFYGEILGFTEVEKPALLKNEVAFGLLSALIKSISVLKSHLHQLKSPPCFSSRKFRCFKGTFN